MIIRQTKNFKVYLFCHGLYFVVDMNGNIVLKTESINEYKKFIA